MSKMLWGGLELHPRYATEHFLVSGATGSGKTILINILLNNVLGDGRGRRRRALIYDPKQEMVPVLYGLGVGPRIRILHPFDQRSSAWDMAHDIDSPVAAREVATILVPEAAEGTASDSFFINAVRDLLTGVLLAFINCVPLPHEDAQWTFRDVLLTLLYEPYLRFILSLDKTREGQPFPLVTRLWDHYLDPKKADPRTVANIRSTISTRLSIYEPIAAAWHHAQQSPWPGQAPTYRIKDWLKDGCYDVLVLGTDEAARAPLDAINAVLFKRLTELILSRRPLTEGERETAQETTWVFLDEVREAGRLDGLSRLLTTGRSRGACVVLGFQDIDGLRHVYDQPIAHELTGQCNNLALLKMNSPSTAEWAANLFGSFLAEEQQPTEVYGDRVETSVHHTKAQRDVLYTRDLIILPKTGPQNGLTGYFRYSGSQEDGPWKYQLDWNEHLLPNRPIPSSHPDHIHFIPRDVSEQYLPPWDREDWARLGWDGEPPPLTSPPLGSDPDAVPGEPGPDAQATEGDTVRVEETVPLQTLRRHL